MKVNIKEMNEKMSKLRDFVQSELKIEMCDVWFIESPLNMCYELKTRFTFPNICFRFSITDEMLERYKIESIGTNIINYIEREIWRYYK